MNETEYQRLEIEAIGDAMQAVERIPVSMGPCLRGIHLKRELALRGLMVVPVSKDAPVTETVLESPAEASPVPPPTRWAMPEGFFRWMRR
jgi:hypothetical protein